jgi:shikimate kinase
MEKKYMGNKIIICGLNGVGKSTLGRKLAKEMNYKFMDIEDYYFPENNTDYDYNIARTKSEVRELLLKDMEKYDDLILSAVKGNYGNEIASMFTFAIYIEVPKKIRLERVKNRSIQKFGTRILPNGDLYKKEKQFFEMVEQRSEQYVTDWLDSLSIPILHIDGTKLIEDNMEPIMKFLKIVIKE